MLSAARQPPGRSRRVHSSPTKLPTIGFLGPLASSAISQWTAAFVQRLRELGWIEGRTVEIEYRWGEGRSERFPEIVAEFVRLKVSVIVTGGTAAVIAAKQATSIIPIVFGSVADPVGTGLVASLARPGGNVTGLSNQSADLPGKRLELLREVIPGLRRVAIMANISNPSNVLEMSEGQAAARDVRPCIRHPAVRHINRTISQCLCGPACGLHSLMLDVPLRPFLLGKRRVRDGVISIDVFSAINPQAGKLGHCRQRRDNGTMLLVILCVLCRLGKALDHRFDR